MKSFFTFLAVSGFALATVFAQNITLKFTGATNGGAHVRIDSVKVQNVSRSWSETVFYPDTVLTFQQTGIVDAQGSTAQISSYPNPFKGTANVAVTMPQSGDATLQVYNLAGQRVAERTMSLQAGKNLFEVHLQMAQVYLLAVTTPQGRSIVKLLNRGAGPENSIIYHANNNVVEKRQSSNPFQSGDVLKITGYTTHNGTVIISREVQQPQTASENFTLFFTLPVAPDAPTVTTTAASSITTTTATSGGNVTSDGGSPVTARGVCWSTSPNPTVSYNRTVDGSGTGTFTSSISGLVAGTTYYVRSYATNAAGTAYGNQITFTTTILPPTVTTTAASGITLATATSGGNVTSDGGSAVTAKGVCWGTSSNPTVSGNHTTDSSGTSSFTSRLTGLTAGTTYYLRAYATNTAGTSYGNQISFTTTAAVFSVSASTHVRFSPGNLQWSAKNGGSTATTHTVAGGGTAAGTWRFAPNQWDTIGNANSNISSSYSGWIDLFGWGTSGYNSKYPYLSSTTTSDYGNNNFDLSGTNYDWGVYNAIYNPKTQTTDAPGTWRTLTASEWDYVINSRSGISFALAKVNGVPGFIIVPDGWSSSIYTLNNTNRATVSFSANVITLAQWTTLENAGCVFLPAAGIRDGYSPTNVGSDGYYWSATSHSGDGAYYMSFSGWVEGNYWFYRYHALSVRLVRTVQ